jgi:hypothetical protein
MSQARTPAFGPSPDWVERTRPVRFLFYGLMVLAGAASFAIRGQWALAAILLGIGLGMLGLLWWVLESVRRTPTLDIEKSLRKVGARRERP